MLHHGDCRQVMATLPPASIDAIVTDPPYGLVEPRSGGDGSLGRQRWEPRAEEAKARRRAGFMGQKWDSGVPGIEYWVEAYRVLKPGGHLLAFGGTRTFHRLAVALEDAGFEIRDTLCWLFGSGFPKSRGLLKPAYEPIILARKPAPRMTPLNIDGCRIEGEPWKEHDATGLAADKFFTQGEAKVIHKSPHDLGRWPANVVHDGLAEPWARYFYCAKSSRSERNAGLDGMPERAVGTYAQDEWSRQNMGNTPDAERKPAANHHPTVKPIALMRWLCRLVTPPGGTILDPFLGSGTTGCAAALEGFAFVGIEQDAEYLDIARRRIDHWTPTVARAAD